MTMRNKKYIIRQPSFAETSSETTQKVIAPQKSSKSPNLITTLICTTEYKKITIPKLKHFQILL